MKPGDLLNGAAKSAVREWQRDVALRDLHQRDDELTTALIILRRDLLRRIGWLKLWCVAAAIVSTVALCA